MKTLTTNSFEETQEIGFDFGKNLKKGAVIALYGNLGSGKTTLVQGLAKGLGIKGKIISPTFIIVRSYVIPAKEGIQKRPRSPIEVEVGKPKSFYHIDLYRINTETDLLGLGLEEILNDPSNIVAIEWPEKIEKLLPSKKIVIKFEYVNENERKIQINE